MPILLVLGRQPPALNLLNLRLQPRVGHGHELALLRVRQADGAAPAPAPAGARLFEAGVVVLPRGVGKLVRPALGVLPPGACVCVLRLTSKGTTLLAPCLSLSLTLVRVRAVPVLRQKV